MSLSITSFRKSESSARRTCVLGFFFLVMLSSCKTHKPVQAEVITSLPMTVIALSHEQTDSRFFWKVVFKESQRFYVLADEKKEELKVLEESLKNKTPVIVTLSDEKPMIIITSVRKAA